MLGAIIGDVIGSRFEKANVKTKDFELFTKASRFTDDTVLSIAVADSILKGSDYGASIKLAFLASRDFEDAIRTAISIGGDSDTIACMTGAIAQAFYEEIPIRIIEKTKTKLPGQFLQVLERFEEKFGNP